MKGQPRLQRRNREKKIKDPSFLLDIVKLWISRTRLLHDSTSQVQDFALLQVVLLFFFFKVPSFFCLTFTSSRKQQKQREREREKAERRKMARADKIFTFDEVIMCVCVCVSELIQLVKL